jgi:uncharacterized membrane protein
MMLGSAFVAVIFALVGWSSSVALAALLGGFAGASVDTVLGATVQARRRCASCDAPTERAVHWCGAGTIHVGGARWLDNDIVNVFCTATGALVAMAI